MRDSSSAHDGLDARVTRVLDLLARAATADYVGEPVSQLEHALQAGALARAARVSEFEAAAALLHDVGHLDGVAGEQVAQMIGADAGTLGVVGHESVGAAWLRAQGFDPRLCELVGAHVAAKRYLVATRPSYAARLSDASRQTLALQGGPMSPGEVEAFERDPLRDAKLRLRRFDEDAKVPGAEVPGLDSWAATLRGLLCAS